MIKNVIFEFDEAIKMLKCDDLFGYEGKLDPQKIHSLQANVDTTDYSLSIIGDILPNLQKLRLNNSIIPNVRDIGCNFVNLRFLSLAQCGITSLNGISTLSRVLEELYLAYNQITDVSDLMGMDKLKVLDLEDNKITDISNLEFLTCCSGLRALTLAGNPATQDPEVYRSEVLKLIPQVIYLDEKRLKPKQPRRKSGDGTPRKINRQKSTDDRIKIHPPDSVVVKPPESPPRIVRPFHESPPKVTSLNFNIIPQPLLVKDNDSDQEEIFTEMVGDMVEDRPTTARGSYEKSFLKTPINVSTRNKTSKLKVKPHLVTPRVSHSSTRSVSSFGRKETHD